MSNLRSKSFAALKRAFLWVLKTLAGIVLIYVFLLIATAVLLRSFAPRLPEKGLLVIDVERGWVETPTERSPLFDLIVPGRVLPGAGRPYSLMETIGAIEDAAGDPRITGLVVTGDFAQAPVNRIGLAGIADLGEAVAAFGEAKPTYAYLSNPGHGDLLLAAYCENRMLSPAGDTAFTGIATEVLFFAEAFETVGVGVQVAREGTHKSAVEPYTRTGFSEEGKAQQERLTEGLWATYLDQLTAPTGIGRAVFEGWANDEGLLTPEAVAASGFAEVVAYSAFLDRMIEAAGTHPDEPATFSQIGLDAYFTAEKPGASEGGDAAAVAVVFVEGILANEDGGMLVDGERVARQIRLARRSGDYDALVLRVNSPGGAVYPSKIIADELARTAEELPVFVSMGQYAASGGYWVSAPGDHIAASPLTVTGSIGVFAVLPNLAEAADKLGLHFERTQSAEMANLFSVSEAKSPAQMQAIQNLVSRTYEDFIELVAGNRELSKNEADDAAQGRVWTGGEALDRELVDATGGLRALKALLRDELGVDRLEFELQARQADSLVDAAFSWTQGKVPFRDAARAAEALQCLQRYRGPLSYSPLRVE